VSVSVSTAADASLAAGVSLFAPTLRTAASPYFQAPPAVDASGSSPEQPSWPRSIHFSPACPQGEIPKNQNAHRA
jgi:hypothetical protein